MNLFTISSTLMEETSYMSSNTHFMHELVLDVAAWSMYLLELFSVIIIVFTTVIAFYRLFRGDGYARVYLLHGLSISLTFKLGAEILRTITAASITDIIEVFLLIAIKAAIMLLIERELKAIEEDGIEGEDILHIHHHVHDGQSGKHLFSIHHQKPKGEVSVPNSSSSEVEELKAQVASLQKQLAQAQEKQQ